MVQKADRCIFCGQILPLNEQGICKECEKKVQACHTETSNSISNGIKPAKKNAIPVEEVLPKTKIVRKLYDFYKFFHRWSIITSITVWVGWIIYCAYSYIKYSSDQLNATKYYLATGQTKQITPFNVHWSVPVIATLILILGLFFSYVSAALCKWVENMEK